MTRTATKASASPIGLLFTAFIVIVRTVFEYAGAGAKANAGPLRRRAALLRVDDAFEVVRHHNGLNFAIGDTFGYF